MVRCIKKSVSQIWSGPRHLLPWNKKSPCWAHFLPKSWHKLYPKWTWLLIPKRIQKHKLILILVYTTPPCSCCFAFFWTTFLLTCGTSWRYRRMLSQRNFRDPVERDPTSVPVIPRLRQVQKAKVEVPSIEVVAQIMEELNYKCLGLKIGGVNIYIYI